MTVEIKCFFAIFLFLVSFVVFIYFEYKLKIISPPHFFLLLLIFRI